MIGFVIIFSMAVAQASAKAHSSNNNKVCESPLLSDLKKSGTEISKFPNQCTSKTSCSDEWAKAGTCCEWNSLVQTYNKEVAATQQSLQNILTWVGEVLTISKSYHPTVANETFMEGIKDICRVRFYTAFDQIAAGKNFDSFNTTTTTCWNHMNKIRGSALWSICSGRYEQFLNGNKSLIHLDDCKTTIENCNQFVSLAEHVIQGLNDVIKIGFECFNSTMNLQERRNYANARKFTNHLKKGIPPLNLKKAIQQFEKAHEPEKSKLSITICEAILNIRKQTLLDYFDKEVVSNSPPPKTFDLHSNSNRLLSLSTKRQNWYISRSLDSSVSLSAGFNPFTSDSQVFLAQQDNMFTSYDGAAGTSLEHATTWKEPMNLTMPFP